MAPEGSAPYSQEPATCPYPELDRSCKKLNSVTNQLTDKPINKQIQ
jgi:hypothetical protein